MSWLGRLRRGGLPEGFSERLASEEQPLAAAGELLATSRGLWVPVGGCHRRIGWHLISKAVWRDGVLTVVEARETGTVAGVVLLRDLPPQRWPLAEPGKLPEAVRRRVTESVRSSHHRELPGGGAWVVQRKVPGVGGVTLQVRAEPGTEARAVSVLAEQVADGVRRLREQ
ncbi:MAG: hypothetical protein ACRDRN_17580 [Sciscionella sp.]